MRVDLEISKYDAKDLQYLDLHFKDVEEFGMEEDE